MPPKKTQTPKKEQQIQNNSSMKKSILETLREEEEAANMLRGDFEKAKQYEQQNSIMNIVDGKPVKYSVFTDNKVFGKNGIGIQLYMSFLKRVGWMFFLMFLISLPSVYYNYEGEGLLESQKSVPYLITTLANQPKYVSHLPANYASLSYADQQLALKAELQHSQAFQTRMTHNLYYATLPDIAYTLLFFFFIQYLKKKSKAEIQIAEDQTIETSDYAVKVRGFPGKICRDKGELLQLFQNNVKGQIVEAVYERDYKGSLLSFQKLGVLNEKKKLIDAKDKIDPKVVSKKQRTKLEAKYEKLKLRQKKQTKKLGGRPHDDFNAFEGIVVFDNLKEREMVLKRYAKFNTWWYRNCWCFPCCDARKQMPKTMQLQGKYPLVLDTTVEKPSNINWENIDATNFEKRYKKIISFMCIFLLMCISFLVILAANVANVKDVTTCPKLNFTHGQAIQNKSDSTYYNCYCAQVNVNVLKDDQIIRTFCEQYLIDTAIKIFLTVLASGTIVAVNVLLKNFVQSLAKYERYSTLTEESSKIVQNTFLAIFINTALITLILNGKVFGISPSYEVASLVPSVQENLESKISSYQSDFTRLWYTGVGMQIMTTWIVQMISPHVFVALLSPLMKCLKRRSAKKQFLQVEMNKAMLGPEFQFAASQAIALNTVFVSLLFSSGMPAMLLIGSISLLLQYYAQKYMLLRIYKSPPKIGSQINTTVLQWCEYAILLHCMFSVYMYGCNDIFPSHISILGIDMVGISRDDLNINDPDVDNLINRAYKVIYLFVVIGMYIAYKIFDKTLNRLLNKIKNCIFYFICCCRGNKQKVSESQNIETQGTFMDSLVEIKQNGLASYDIRSNSKYANMIDAIDDMARVDTNVTQP